jgi:DNA polymerase I
MTSGATELPAPGAPDVLYLIDLSGYLFRAYHALPPLTSPSGEPTGAVFGTVAMLSKLFVERQPAMVGVAMDSPGPTFRVEIDAKYKANRPPTPPDLPPQIQRCRQIVEAWRIPVFARPGLEADDFIATLTRSARRDGLRVVIASSDKDLMQLVEPAGVWMWDAMRNRAYGPAEVVEKLGVPPAQVRDLLALVGDSSDNVAGVPGIGPKTAAKLLSEFGSIAELYRGLERIERSKLREALRDHEPAVRLAMALVSLRDDLPIEHDRAALRYRGDKLADDERTRLHQLFVELGFQRLAESFEAAPAAASDAAPPMSAVATGDAPRAPTDAAPVPGPSSPAAAGPVILSAAELEALCARARQTGRLALVAFGSEPEPMRAALVGIALGTGTGEDARYLPLGPVQALLGSPPGLALELVRALLGPVLGDDAVSKLGHDLKLSMVLLERHGLGLDRAGFDTMLASYLLDPEASHELPRLAERDAELRWPALPAGPSARGRGAPALQNVGALEAAPYAAMHAQAVLGLEARYRPVLEHEGLAALLGEVELPLLAVLARMELDGVLLRPESLGPLGEQMAADLAALERQAFEAAGHSFNLASPKQLETVLYDELGLRPSRKTKTGRSTDAEALEAVADDHPLPRLVLEHRAVAKLKGTYVDTLPKLINPTTGRIHTKWDQAGTATGRIASKDPNLQNIPVRTAHGKRIREAFAAPEGKLILSADYSQIELRVLAHLSKDPVLCAAFAAGEDVHVRTAMEIFGVPATEVTDTMRRQSKTINFGILYGMGPVALGKRLGIARAEAGRFIDAYLERYRGVREMMDRTLAEARADRTVRTMLGRVRRLPDIDSGNHQRRAYAERIAQNTPIQGTAADLLKLAMVKLAEPVVPGARMVLTVHDELVFEVPDAAIDEAAAKTKALMESAFPLDVPLVVDVGWGRNWAEAH